MEIDYEKTHERKQSDYSCLQSERFEIQKEMCRGQQYSQIYFALLHLMKTLLYSLAPTWKPHSHVCKVLGLEKNVLLQEPCSNTCVLNEYSKEVRWYTVMSRLLGLTAQIVHVVIAGNSVEFPRKLLTGKIAAGVSVVIMPGMNDPSNLLYLSRCLFTGSAPYNTFGSCTNTHSFDVDNVRFLGTSGQNIDDLDKYSESESKIDLVERTLRWRHLASTAPNTLGCYPFTDRDPFLIESCPDVYFVGNQDKYDTRLVKGSEGQLVRLICIPKFCEAYISKVTTITMVVATCSKS
ncbi:hypothetical protein N665_4374s0005 [Sinapis alba]|nr:hypothetical protein N665_4374s0005 [Sinapis alba]